MPSWLNRWLEHDGHSWKPGALSSPNHITMQMIRPKKANMQLLKTNPGCVMEQREVDLGHYLTREAAVLMK